MVEFGLLQRTPNRGVRIGVRPWELAYRAPPTLGLREAAMPFMEDLHAVNRVTHAVLRADPGLTLTR